MNMNILQIDSSLTSLPKYFTNVWFWILCAWFVDLQISYMLQIRSYGRQRNHFPLAQMPLLAADRCVHSYLGMPAVALENFMPALFISVRMIFLIYVCKMYYITEIFKSWSIDNNELSFKTYVVVFVSRDAYISKRYLIWNRIFLLHNYFSMFPFCDSLLSQFVMGAISLDNWFLT